VHRRGGSGHEAAQERIAGSRRSSRSQQVVGDRGADGVTGLALKNLKNGAEPHRRRGAFIFVGTTPNTEFLRGFLPLDARASSRPARTRTTIPGVGRRRSGQGAAPV
jgi:thioredoxin reductase